MNTKDSIKNPLFAMIQNFILIVIGFISQKIFINILNIEYLGLNGLFNNVLSMLGIIELGIGNAIIYNLYKPLKNNDYETINSLMKFFKKAYRIITYIIFIIGLLIIPLLPYFVNKVTIDININIIYILFLLDICASYVLSYKRSIIYANQKNYIINIIHIICTLLLNTTQLLILFITKNYYIYLVLKIIFRLIENVTITLFARKNYTYLNEKNAKDLDKYILKDITTKIKALFFHKIGTVVVLGTDNIIISKFLGLITVGLYNNYYLIINSINTLFGQAIISITPSVGHLLVENNKEKNYNVFKAIRFINFWIASFSGMALLLLIKPFIILWLGEDYLLSNLTLIVLVFNYYQKMMRNCYSVFKEGAGIYYEDRFVPIFESITNIIASIILVKIIGLPGVFMGTIISGLWLWLYSYPKYIYKKLFNRSYYNYYKETFSYILLFILIALISYYLSNIIHINNNYISFVKNALITLFIPNIIIYILFKNSDNFKYFKNLIKIR